MVSSCLNSPARSFCLLLQYQSLLCAAVVEAQVTAAEFSSWTGDTATSGLTKTGVYIFLPAFGWFLAICDIQESPHCFEKQKTDDYTKCHKPLTSESSPCVALHPSAAEQPNAIDIYFVSE